MPQYQTIPSAPPPELSRGLSASRIDPNRCGLYTKLVVFTLLFILCLLLLFPLSTLATLLRNSLFPNTTTTAPQHLTANATLTYLLHIAPRDFVFEDFGPQCKFTLYSYGQDLPGPTLYLEPGQSFAVDVVNLLHPGAAAAETAEPAMMMNKYHGVNTTTVHFHGLHVSPVTVDDVLTPIQANSTRRITGKLMDAHPSGTYLVHPHFHGSSAVQMGFAMASALVVRDVNLEWRALEEHILLLQIAGIANGHAYSDVALAFAQNHAGMSQHSGATCEPKTFALINGRSRALHSACDARARRWRVIHAGTDGALVLRWVSPATTCLLYEIARDGIYRNKPKQMMAETGLVLLPSGGRVDFVVVGEHCDGAQLVSRPESAPEWLGHKSNLFPSAVLAICHDEHSEPPQAMPSTLPRPPAYMPNLLKSKAVRQRRIFQWTEFTPEEQMKTGAKYGINGEPFDSNIAHFAVRLGHVEEWLITNAYDESHPFHIHTNHFQVMGDSANAYERGIWLDTAFVPARGNLTLRWQPQHFVGSTLVHCHILQHEDLGMTWRVDILSAL